MNDTASVNKAYFNKLAADYDSRFEKTITQLVGELQKRRYFISSDWDEEDSDDEDSIDDNDANAALNGARKSTKESTREGNGNGKTPVRLLDYACGTGMVSRSLAQYTTQCVGVDISENMVGAYNVRAENQGLAKDEMYAHHGNLTDPSDPSPAALAGDEFFNFDLAAVGLGFHHFDDPEYAAKQLVQRLKPGGVLFILDFFPHGPMEHGHSHGHGHNHDHGHSHAGHSHGPSDGQDSESKDPRVQESAPTVMHHGFSEERIKAIFEGAGAGKDFAVAELGSGIVFHGTRKDGHVMTRRVFLARGVKA